MKLFIGDEEIPTDKTYVFVKGHRYYETKVRGREATIHFPCHYADAITWVFTHGRGQDIRDVFRAPTDRPFLI